MPPSHDVTTDSESDIALSALLNLIEDYHDFNPDLAVPVFPYPTELQFSQQVARGRPCVYCLDRNVLSSDTGAEGAFDDGGLNGDIIDAVKEQKKDLFLREAKQARLEAEQWSILTAPCFAWTKKTLCELLTEEVEVAVTPDGRADSLYSIPRKRRRKHRGEETSVEEVQADHTNNEDVYTALERLRFDEDADEDSSHEQVFLQPATTHMALSNLMDKLCPPDSSSSHSPSPLSKPVYYLQSQDSNLSRAEMAPLLSHLPASPPPFALPTLGDPEATNIWIGNERSVTSTHRDPYENLYLVVKGRKKFVLYAPVEEVCLHAKMVRSGKWAYDEGGGKFDIVMDEGASDGEEFAASSHLACEGVVSESSKPSQRIPWISIDPSHPPPPPSSIECPHYRHARPMSVTVNEGEILYLPAGWFHHVTQECGEWPEDENGNLTKAPCIAINYWFDMEYSGEKHVMREMVGRLVERVRKRRPG